MPIVNIGEAAKGLESMMAELETRILNAQSTRFDKFIKRFRALDDDTMRTIGLIEKAFKESKMEDALKLLETLPDTSDLMLEEVEEAIRVVGEASRSKNTLHLPTNGDGLPPDANFVKLLLWIFGLGENPYEKIKTTVDLLNDKLEELKDAGAN